MKFVVIQMGTRISAFISKRCRTLVINIRPAHSQIDSLGKHYSYSCLRKTLASLIAAHI